jgi:putative ABC transport system ATP-binding protein
MKTSSPVDPVVDLQHASKTYRAGDAEVQALVDVSLSVLPGEYLSIMGPSGCGKSTLLNVLGTLDRLDQGTYRLDGQCVEDVDDETLSGMRARKLGFVFQAFHLLPRYTAVENVELALLYARSPRKTRRQRALRALETVGLLDRAEHLPSQLSGGQQQRVSLARALVNEPSLLLADEPTGALDSTTTEEILDLFDELHEGGCTLLVVTHDTSVGMRARRSVTMRDGRVATDSRRARPLESGPAPAGDPDGFIDVRVA